MDKFGRNYHLYVQTQSGDILDIGLPLTMEFDITRKLTGSANHSSIRVYNLNADHRNQIRFNQFDFGTFRSVKLYAGYRDSLALIFSGNIHEAWSVREGVNFISQIESFDIGTAFLDSPFNNSFPKGTNQTTIMKNVAKSMSNATIGVISNSYSATITRGNSLSGNAVDLLQKIAGDNGAFFIDNGKVNCLKSPECLSGDVQVISPESGLLNTPILQGTVLTFEMIFEPRLIVGQLIVLQSTTDKIFNGSYKITGISHRGMISESVCGEAITTVECLTGIGQLIKAVAA